MKDDKQNESNHFLLKIATEEEKGTESRSTTKTNDLDVGGTFRKHAFAKNFSLVQERERERKR